MERRHLVYVLPGIGGSVLQRPRRGGGFATVWDAGFGDIGDLLARPGRMSVEEHERLRPVGLISSKHLLPGWAVVHGYDRLERDLRRLPGVRLDAGHPERRVADANVVFFPYDFRRSLVEAAERLDADVQARLRALGGDSSGRVVVVAHSLGGLVARFWMGPMEGWRVCRALVTLGTPHRGAPKALDVVANGVPVGAGRLRRPARVLAGWDAVGELLPTYRAVWDQKAETSLYPQELPLEVVRALADAGYAVHSEITKAWGRSVPRQGPEVRAYFGYSHGTARSARWHDGRLEVVTDPPRGDSVDLAGWQDDLGDGSVPAFCAVPVEASGHDMREFRVKDKHTPLAVNALIVRLLEHYEGRADITAIQAGPSDQVALGLDVAELHAAGDPVPVQVRIRGVSQPVMQVPVWVQLYPADRQDAKHLLAEERAHWDGYAEAFCCELAGLAPGLYDLVVRARSVPGVGDLACTDAIGVIEP